MTTVRNGYDRRDHLMLSSIEWEVRRHQRAKRRKRMIERVGNQAVRRDDTRGFSVGSRMYRRRILNRVQLALRLDRLPHFFTLINSNGFDPRHCIVPLSTKRLLR